MEYISASRLKTLTDCKKLFYHKYILQEIEDEDSPYAQLGSAVHKVLEIYRQNPELTRRGMVGILAKEFQPPKDMDWLFKEGCRMIWKLDLKKVVLGELIDVELEFEETINGVPFKGIIDKVERLDNGTLVVTDYKTNKAVKPELYVHQLALYDIAMEHLYPGTNREYELLYVRHNRSVPFQFTDDHYREALETTANVYKYVVEHADDKHLFPKLNSKGQACNWCPLKNSCWG